MTAFWYLRSRRLRRLLAALAIAGVVLAFVVPVAVAVLWSLVDPATGWFPPDILPRSLSLANWRAVLAVPEMAEALATSLTVAAAVTLLSAVVGLPTGIALGQRDFRFRRLAELLVLTPLMLPGIVLATGLGAVFIRLGLSQTLIGVVLAQAVVVLPLMIRVIAATSQGIPQDLIDAARNLGAGPLATTRTILVPLLLPGLFAGALLSFIASLDEFVLSFVVGMPTVETLPMLLWNYMGGRSSILTSGAVVTLTLLLPTLVLLFVAERALKQEHLAAAFGKA